MGYLSDATLTASELTRRQRITDDLIAEADDREAENAYQFALELHALIAKHNYQDKAPLILEGACESIVEGFADHLKCYAAFEDAEAAHLEAGRGPVGKAVA